MPGSSITYHHRHFADHIWNYKEAFLRYVCHNAVISFLFPLYLHSEYKEYINLRKKFMSMQCIRLIIQLKETSEMWKMVSTKSRKHFLEWWPPLWLKIFLLPLTRVSDEETYLLPFLDIRQSSCYLSFICFLRRVISATFPLFILSLHVWQSPEFEVCCSVLPLPDTLPQEFQLCQSH